MQKIGVFVCWCGSNIAATVDVKAVAEAVKSEPGVVFSTDYQYMCSENGQAMIREAIREYKLTGIVICSCSPRMHEATFRKTALQAFFPEVAERNDFTAETLEIVGDIAASSAAEYADSDRIHSSFSCSF